MTDDKDRLNSLKTAYDLLSSVTRSLRASLDARERAAVRMVEIEVEIEKVKQRLGREVLG